MALSRPRFARSCPTHRRAPEIADTLTRFKTPICRRDSRLPLLCSGPTWQASKKNHGWTHTSGLLSRISRPGDFPSPTRPEICSDRYPKFELKVRCRYFRRGVITGQAAVTFSLFITFSPFPPPTLALQGMRLPAQVPPDEPYTNHEQSARGSEHSHLFEEEEDEDHARQVASWSTLPWWKRPSPYWSVQLCRYLYHPHILCKDHLCHTLRILGILCYARSKGSLVHHARVSCSQTGACREFT